jgi:hypothetical protein
MATIRRFKIISSAEMLVFFCFMNIHCLYTPFQQAWVLFLEITCESKTQGLAIEKHIKKMKSRVYIENLIKYPENHCKLRINRLTLSPKASPFISSSTELKSSRSTFFAMTPPFK